jgi:hypothetical protein
MGIPCQGFLPNTLKLMLGWIQANILLNRNRWDIHKKKMGKSLCGGLPNQEECRRAEQSSVNTVNVPKELASERPVQRCMILFFLGLSTIRAIYSKS